ncbi:MAG: 16S rRNA (cytidine(1402)-2'-O)-methyltransferase [Deferribacterota bacterium]|nr:16S rRNA (cytidine(1402)-2'-O)-methyltransferase [Deferribacterota bacterium]
MKRNNALFYYIPTPIGNLKDITLRALDILKEVDLIYSEDTRVTRKLLSHYNIKKPIYTYNKDNELNTAIKIIDLLKGGKKIALTTDAGTPCISDPGNILAKKLITENIPFEVLPGATAFVLALIYSGFNTKTFYFNGFLSNKKNERKKELLDLRKIKTTIILYESCHRIKETLNDILAIFTPPFFVCRELTKIFEEHVFVYNSNNVAEITEKGEFIVVIDNNKIESHEKTDINLIIEKLLKEEFSNKDIVKILKILGYNRNRAYNLLKDITSN